MLIVAICPYCKEGRVRAPNTAVGLSATCPKCHNSFTLVASDEPAVEPASAAKAASPITAKPVASSSSQTNVTATVPMPSPARDQTPLPVPVTAPLARPASAVRFAPRPSTTDLGFVLALIAIIVAGAAFFVSQVPYGRYGTVGLALVGMVIGGGALLMAERQRLWPVVGLALNGIALFLIVFLPGWLAVPSWRPAPVVIARGATKLVPFDGKAATDFEGDWLDTSKGSWQRDDVRIRLANAAIGPVQLSGPKNARETSKDKVLVVSLQISNVGPERRIAYRSWQQPPPPQGSPVRVTDSTGKELAAKKFDDGWDVANRAQNFDITPGRTHEDLFVFEAPDANAEFVRLELPVWAVERTGEPVRLQIPKHSISGR